MIKVSFIDWIGLSGKQIVLLGSKVCYKIKHKIKITIQLYPYDSYWFIGWMKWVFCCTNIFTYILWNFEKLLFATSLNLEFRLKFQFAESQWNLTRFPLCTGIEIDQIERWSVSKPLQLIWIALRDLSLQYLFRYFQYFHCKIVAIVGY